MSDSLQNQLGIIGKSIEIKEILDVIEQVAPTDITVLITGESGTGKEIFAKAIHQASLRSSKPLISVNAGAIPEGIIESELFGHEKGSFTGALETRKGYFELANGGTIFLDEIGELPAATQVKFLRVLESGEYMRVGSSTPRKVDVRIIAATNKNLESEVRQGNFRADLYFRLRSINIHIPPLRERREDIPLLAEEFAKTGKKLTIYSLGNEFSDLCEGPHLPDTGFVKAMKLMIIASAYWRGDQKNKQLIRVYGTAFPSDKELRTHLKFLEELEKRDHRKLGKDLELFMFHEYSPGSPFMLPKGSILYNELLDFLLVVGGEVHLLAAGEVEDGRVVEVVDGRDGQVDDLPVEDALGLLADPSGDVGGVARTLVPVSLDRLGGGSGRRDGVPRLVHHHRGAAARKEQESETGVGDAAPGAVRTLTSDEVLGADLVPVELVEVLVSAGDADALDAVERVETVVHVAAFLDEAGQRLGHERETALDRLHPGVGDVALAVEALVGIEELLGDEQGRDAGGGDRGGVAFVAGIAAVRPAA